MSPLGWPNGVMSTIQWWRLGSRIETSSMPGSASSMAFAQLQSEMTGKDHDSLGKAIHDLKPSVDAKAAAKTAEQEADVDLKAAGKARKDKDDK